MKKTLTSLFLVCALLTGCRSDTQTDSVVSLQVIDRNGFSETVSNKNRLKTYEVVNFLEPQPYQKVLRVFGKDREGKSRSKLTSYHGNGGVWQYLEALDGRANGRYLEWHENGKLKIEAYIIEGLADLGPQAQKSWLFDRECIVWNEKGDTEAEFTYTKGHLDGMARYYHANGTLSKMIPYSNGIVDGTLYVYDNEGDILEEIPYKTGNQHGAARGYWGEDVSKYQEQYREGHLINAVYFDRKGDPIAEIKNGEGTKAIFDGKYLSTLIQYRNGNPEGEVKFFNQDNALKSCYVIHNGKKSGQEWEYYPSPSENLHPKLMITWSDDKIQGMVKTWYQNGALESQREMTENKKQGLSFAYYKNGDLMLMEEYENDRLTRGSYYKQGEKEPTSVIDQGAGVATIFHADGYFLKKINYEGGRPVVDPF